MLKDHKPLRVLLDTNVLVSAAIAEGRPAEVVQLGLRSSLQILTTAEILIEMSYVLLEKIGLAEPDVVYQVECLTEVAEIVRPIQVESLIEGESVDNIVLAAAVEGKADFLVTGDHRHLIPLGNIGHTPILTPAKFLAHYYKLNPDAE